MLAALEHLCANRVIGREAGAELVGGLAVSARDVPSAPGANGTLMARRAGYRGKPDGLKPAADLRSTLTVSAARLREPGDGLGDSGLYDIFDRAETVCRAYLKNAADVCGVHLVYICPIFNILGVFG